MTMVSPTESWAIFSPMPKLLAVRLERVSLDDIAPTHSTRRLPCNDEPC